MISSSACKLFLFVFVYYILIEQTLTRMWMLFPSDPDYALHKFARPGSTFSRFESTAPMPGSRHNLYVDCVLWVYEVKCDYLSVKNDLFLLLMSFFWMLIDEWEKRWVKSDWKKDVNMAGEWNYTSGKWNGDPNDKGNFSDVR